MSQGTPNGKTSFNPEYNADACVGLHQNCFAVSYLSAVAVPASSRVSASRLEKPEKSQKCNLSHIRFGHTDFPAYSDTLGTWEKCHCKQVSL